MVNKKILNPKTGRYVNYNGVLGKKIRKEMKGGSSEYPGNSLSGRGMPYQRTDLNLNSVSCCGQKGGNANYPDSFKTPNGRWLSHPFDANALKKTGGGKKKSSRKKKQKAGGADYPASFKKQPYGGGKKKSPRKNKQKKGKNKKNKKLKGGYNYEYPGKELSGKGWPYERTDFPYKVGINLDEKYLF